MTIPHTWNSVDAVDAAPGYRRGAGWYRRTLSLPEVRKGERVILIFEAVNMKADVYVNGRHAGAHVGGYLGFNIDATPHCTFGQSTISSSAQTMVLTMT